jgi:hypothetical protein
MKKHLIICLNTKNPITEEFQYIVPDDAYGLSAAHNKIYYDCDGVYCEINTDGTDWKKIEMPLPQLKSCEVASFLIVKSL